MTLEIQIDVVTILIFTTLIILFLAYINSKLKKVDPLEKPKGVVLIAVMLVEMIDKMVKDNVPDKFAQWLSPYILTISIYLVVCNVSGLFSFAPPTANFSVTFSLALITFIMVQGTIIKFNKISGYLHGFIEPHPLFLVMNFFGKVAPLISMPLRLFGNIVSGGIIMSLVYAFTSLIGSIITPFLGGFNIFGIVIAPVLHAYFDVFAGFIQMFIFISLTMVFIGNEIPTE